MLKSDNIVNHEAQPGIESVSEMPTVLTVDEVAQLLRVNRNTIYELFQRREIPGGRKVGRCIRFSRDVVVMWLQGNCRDSRSHRR
jgi:excisionase family DNA binding protein